MKEKSDNAIDLLLRRMSRHDGGFMRDGEEKHEHLDADELSSYAQNALPAAARARYTEHLADCSTCRKLVTELSLSLGATAAAAAPVETVSVPGGLKKFLASLFSPMVLRYAVPALALIVVAAIGFVFLQQRNRQDSVAQVMNEQPMPATAAPSASTFGDSPAAGYVDPKRETANTSPVEQPKESAPKSGIVSSEPAGAGTGTGPAAVAPPVRDEKRAAEPQNTVASEPPPPSPAKTAGRTDAEEQKKLDLAKQQEAAARKQDAVTVQTKESEIATTDSVRGVQSAPQKAGQAKDENKAKDAPAAGVGSVARARVFSAGRADSDKSDADTRTVSGRRFRKERGIWTDTAYDSSTATVNVARGSEQFRALVADEPEIKKIAEQLDGEVIVVWKGRAYRIR